MKVKVKAKYDLFEDSAATHLSLIIKFKLPNQKFYRKRECTLVSNFHKSDQDFFEECTLILNCWQVVAERNAKDIVRKYIKNSFVSKNKKSNMKTLESRIKQIDEIEFEFEVDYD